MHYIHKWRVALLLLTALSVVPEVSSADSPNDIVVFGNNGLSVSSVTIDELKQIFLKKKTSWRGGDRIVCINTPSSVPVRAKFREKVLGMSARDEEIYWENQKVRKQLTPPPEMMGTPKAVFKLKNSISYAFRKDVPKNVVKVLLVIPAQ